MRKSLFVVLFLLLFAFLKAQEKPSASEPPPKASENVSLTETRSQGGAYAIHYVPSNRTLKNVRHRIEKFDQISVDLQNKIAKLLENRGLHLAQTSEPVRFNIAINLFKAVSTELHATNLLVGVPPQIVLAADLSIADDKGMLLFRKSFEGRGNVAGNSERVVTVAEKAIYDMVRNIENEASFNKVLSLSGSGAVQSATPLTSVASDATAPTMARASANRRAFGWPPRPARRELRSPRRSRLSSRPLRLLPLHLRATKPRPPTARPDCAFREATPPP